MTRVAVEVFHSQQAWLRSLVRDRLGKEIQHHDSRDDQAEADDGWEIQGLFEDKSSDEADYRDAQAGPDGIGDADWDGTQAEREKVKRDAIAHEDDHSRPRLGKPFTRLERSGPGDFGKDGDEQVNVRVHRPGSIL